MARRTLLRKWIVKLRMFWADVRGHHGKVWDYEPGDYYMGSHKGHNKHLKKAKMSSFQSRILDNCTFLHHWVFDNISLIQLDA